MRGPRVGWLVLILAASAGVWPSHARAAAHTWEFRHGQWQTVRQPTTQPLNDPVLDDVEQLIARRQNTTARKTAVQWLKLHKQSPLRDRALYLVAAALYQSGDRIKAFYYLDELMDEYPSSSLFHQALQLQYNIADAYLEGYKIKFLGIPMFGASGEAIEMLYRIQQRAPGAPLAEKALRRTADWYYSQSDFDLAADAYAAYVHQYPNSPDIPRIRLREAFASLAQFRGIHFDATPLIDARTQLVRLAAEYPQLAKEENLLSVVQRIDQTFAAKVYATADFYRRTDKPRAAVYIYRFLIQTYPNSTQANKAKAQLKQMPEEALAAPAPLPTQGYAPATRPSHSAPEGP
jgi:outer membrane protein assembly factor BamD (BamD/ComL family)